jgi:gas vesicle protein
MSISTNLENTTLKEKLLSILKNNNLRPVIEEVEFYMYVYDLDSYLAKFKDKGKALIDKIKQLIGKKVKDLTMYSVTEWAAAYIIAHESQKIEELAKIYQINMTKRESNYELNTTIKKMIHDLDALIYNLTKQINESKNENIYYGTVETIEQASYIKECLSEFVNKIEKDNKEIFESAANAKRELNEIIHGILENLQL